MKHSDSIKTIAGALLLVQKELEPVVKDGTNPHFKNKYVTLDSLIEVVKPILNRHGIVLLQGGDNGGIETTLLHQSGEWISFTYVMPLEKLTPQGAGSATTYGRRYGLASILSISTEEDDDAQGAEGGVRLVRLQEEYSQTKPVKSVVGAEGNAHPACPKCNSDMWDNRLSKKNPKAPDFKCKDPKCDGVIWPPKGGPDAQTKSNTEAVRSQLQAATAVEEEPDDLPF